MPTTGTTPLDDDDEAALLEDLRATTELLERIAADWGLLDRLPADARRQFHRAVALMANPVPKARRKKAKALKRTRKAAAAKRDETMLGETGIRALRRRPVITTPNVFPPKGFEPRDLPPSTDARRAEARRERQLDPQRCYVCKQDYSVIHHFYDQLCPPCAELNFAKRTELADLRGRVALVTGGARQDRLSGGPQAAARRARSSSSRHGFPRDSAARYAREPDFDEWADRLEIFGLDLRHTPSVEAFCRELLATRSRLDFIVNNACQTVRRPPEFYAHMMEEETAALQAMPEHERKLLGAYEELRGDHDAPARRRAAAGARAARRARRRAGLTHAARAVTGAAAP